MIEKEYGRKEKMGNWRNPAKWAGGIPAAAECAYRSNSGGWLKKSPYAPECGKVDMAFANMSISAPPKFGIDMNHADARYRLRRNFLAYLIFPADRARSALSIGIAPFIWCVEYAAWADAGLLI